MPGMTASHVSLNRHFRRLSQVIRPLDRAAGLPANGFAPARKRRDDRAPARAAHEVYRSPDLRRHAALAELALAIQALGLDVGERLERTLRRLAPVGVDGIDVGEDQQ